MTFLYTCAKFDVQWKATNLIGYLQAFCLYDPTVVCMFNLIINYFYFLIPFVLSLGKSKWTVK